MKNSSDILKFIKNKKIYKLRMEFTTLQAVFTGLIVTSALLFAELIKIIFEYILNTSSGINVASQLLVLALIGILAIILGIFYTKNISFYLSLKERKIDKLNRKKALKIIDEELEEIESI